MAETGEFLAESQKERVNGGENDKHRELIAGRLRELRKKLLDLTNRNRLLSFKHSDRARTHVRVIDELPDILYEKLSDGDRLVFRSLGSPPSHPKKFS